MPVSLYESQVSRLTQELAALRSKLADESKRLADANGKALQAATSLGRASSTSQFQSRARDVERHQKAAASHEKRAAAVETRIASKQRALLAATDRLDRARREQQRRDDAEAARRRQADLDHLRELEDARRRVTALPIGAHPHPPAALTRSPYTDTYDVCLSFAGEQRDYVERIALALKEAGLAVFYDQDQDIAATKLWGRDLGEYLDYIYREASRFCLMFISSDYAEKAWTTHERRSALARAIRDGGDYVLPARFDHTELPGFQPTIGYVDLTEIAPATLVDFVIAKLGASSTT